MTELLTKNTDKLRQEVAVHVAADQVVQGCYWTGSRGCFIGCLAHSHDPLIVEEKYGLPIMVQRIAESIFERLSHKEAVAFFAALPDAVGCDGKNLNLVGWQFLAAGLRDLPLQSDASQAAIDLVIEGIDLLARGLPWHPISARNAARAAAWVAVYSPDWAAGHVADAAAQAAELFAIRPTQDAELATVYLARTADFAVEAAARGAAWAEGDVIGTMEAARRQRDLLLKLITDAEVHHD